MEIKGAGIGRTDGRTDGRGLDATDEEEEDQGDGARRRHHTLFKMEKVEKRQSKKYHFENFINHYYFKNT